MNAPKRTSSSYPGEKNEKQNPFVDNQYEEQDDDDFYEFNFDDYNTLYCVPNEAAECFNIFSQDTLDQINENIPEDEKYPQY